MRNDHRIEADDQFEEGFLRCRRFGFGLWLGLFFVAPILLRHFPGWFHPVCSIAVAMQVLLVLASLVSRWGAVRAFGTLFIVMILTWSVEICGTRTGFPFGSYHYTDMLPYQLGGIPLLIPLAWFMMLVPSWSIAQAILGVDSRIPAGVRIFTFAALSAGAMAAWDLYVDPQMVAIGAWEWENPADFLGMPWTNLIGWWVVAASLTLIIRPGDVPVRPLLGVYTATWLLQGFALAVFLGKTGPVTAGFVIMGAFVLAAWVRECGGLRFLRRHRGGNEA